MKYDEDPEDSLEEALGDRYDRALMNNEPDKNAWQAAYIQGYPLDDVLERATRDDPCP